MMNPLSFLRMHYEFRKEKKSDPGSGIKFHNFWPYDKAENLWFHRFIRHRGIDTREKEIAFFSVFGAREKIGLSRSDVKVFYTGENVQRKLFRAYSNHCTNEADLAIGFEYRNEVNYLRFPLWIMYVIEPELDLAGIRKKLEEISAAGRKIPPAEKKFCSLVASHDENGIRTKMFHALGAIDQVDSGGNLLHNTEDLHEKFKNDKVAFLGRYKFNICPENSDIRGYVTEKAFEAIWAGCIPVYQGSGNDPEPEVLNKNAMLLWDAKDNGASCIQLAKDLHSNTSFYTDFVAQDRFMPGAAEFVLDHMNELEKRLKEKS